MRLSIAKSVALAGLALGAAGPAHAEWALNMPRGVTPISREVYDLHMLIFGICVLIGIGVFGAIVWSIIHHRKSRGAVASQFHESTTVELVWTIVPFIILVVMAIPAAGVLVKMEDSTEPDLTVKVTGYQWMWHYEYMGDDVAFYSKLDTPRRAIDNERAKGEDYLLSVDNRLVLPAGKKVRFHHTSDDVIHSWWVPALSVKKDAIPGYINTNWAKIEEPGVYRGKCTELCGRGHGFMPVVVEAVPPEEFEQWLEQRRGDAKQADGGGEAVAANER
jgi:cytochrome c oxidase subunit 2